MSQDIGFQSPGYVRKAPIGVSRYSLFLLAKLGSPSTQYEEDTHEIRMGCWSLASDSAFFAIQVKFPVAHSPSAWHTWLETEECQTIPFLSSHAQADLSYPSSPHQIFMLSQTGSLGLCMGGLVRVANGAAEFSTRPGFHPVPSIR
jgi:hypothetical protein